MMRLILSLAVIWGVLSAPTMSRADTIAAATCENKSGQLDVQTAINTAVAGDTVTVPAGSCTWTTSVTLPARALTLTGAGIGVTNITDEGNLSYALLGNASTNNYQDISGFTFLKGTVAHNNGIVNMGGTAFAENAFRFHHNRIVLHNAGSRGITVNNVYGLIDHNTLDVTATSGSIQMVSIFGSTSNVDGGWSPWEQPLTLGTAKAVYIEDNTITHNALVAGVESGFDAYVGARYVVRYNTITNTEFCGHHGTDSGEFRSPVSFECYNNSYINNSAVQYRIGTIRGGTGVVHNNTYTGSGVFYGVNLVYYRACGAISTVQAWGRNGCDGTQYVVGNPSSNSTAGRRCCDIATNPTVGVSGCATFTGVNWLGNYGFDATNPDLRTSGSLGVHNVGNNTAFFDGGGAATNGYPCRDQPGRGPGQVLEPIYEWNNSGAKKPTPMMASYNLGDAGDCNGLGVEYYIQLNREYYIATPRPGYTAYTYPHPLIPQASPPAPDPITGTFSMAAFSGNTFAIFIWPRSTDAAHKQYNVYRCLHADACTSLVYSVTPAQAASRLTPDTQFFDSSLYVSGTYYYSVSDVNTSDYVGPASTPVPISVTGKQ